MKTREEIIQGIIDRLVTNTNLKNFSTGSIVRNLIDSIADEFTRVYAELSDVFLSMDLSKAYGGYLDALGRLFGVMRGTAKRAADLTHENFKFYIDPTTGYTAIDLVELIPEEITSEYIKRPDTFIIPAGIRVSNEKGNIVYLTVEDAVFKGNETEVFVPIEAEYEGNAYNVHAGELIRNNLSLAHPEFYIIAPFIKNVNIKSIMNGASTENDDSYRYRIANARYRLQSSNELAIRLAALSVPGVAEIVMRPKFYSYDVIVIPEDYIINEGVLRAVKTAVDSQTAYPIKANVYPLVYRSLRFDIRLVFKNELSNDEYQNIIRIVTETVATYVNKLYPGETFYISNLRRKIYMVSSAISDVIFNEIKLGFYDYKNNEIYDEYSVVGDVSTVWNEKLYTNLDFITVC